MILETKNLRIRDVVPSDEKAFVEMALDGSLNEIGFDKDCSSWMKDWILEAQRLAQKDNPQIDFLAYVIEDKRAGVPIGSVGCSYYEDLKKIGIVYFIGAKYRNKGYASEATCAYIDYFFEHYDETEIILTTREKNTFSQKVAEKSGFVLTTKKMYKDLYDTDEELYRFYSVKRKR